jgi:uncharacterized protein with NRDE domain
MCLLSAAYKAHPDFPLVFVGNRDEYHARPAQAADWWPENILGGRDLEAGGTWLAVNRGGRLGVVTNRPDLPAPAEGARSRGELIPEWLAGNDVAGQLIDNHHAYGGFSLMLIDSEVLNLITGGNGAGKLLRTTSGHGIHGLSNTSVDQPWPKLTWLNEQLRSHLAAGAPDREFLLGLLTRTEPVPNAASHGVPATPFIAGDTYGTRCSTVITVDKGRECVFWEQRFGPGGKPTGDSEFTFRLSE